ncbi:serine hydrolase [Mycobacterium sp.]|uniref:serine hydrolase n=1 Tax=Mycobacterium sp. TaxID=1785 RepID=UPI0025EEC737|nr:serine hydrolase [Mycobacterium sp.]
MLQKSIDDVAGASIGIEWAISFRDATSHEVARSNANSAKRTASVGKLLLLIETARQCDAGELSGVALLSRDHELLVADSGLWQHLRVDALSVDDLCVLIASVSDNVATNVLLKTVGLPALRALSDSLGLVHTALLDFVRDQRRPSDPATLSTGSASELSYLMSQLSRDALVSPAVSAQVNAWLATGVDLSMVGSAFGLDPLAHPLSDRNLFIRNKTGTDPGVRADVGTVGRGAGFYSYAVIANWDASGPDRGDAALAGMRAVGNALRNAVEAAA